MWAHIFMLKIRRCDLIESIHTLGLSVSYDRVLQISTDLGNAVCRQYQEEKVVCPPNLRSGLFTTAAVNNIDHNPSSTSSRIFSWNRDIDLPALLKHLAVKEHALLFHKLRKLTKNPWQNFLSLKLRLHYLFFLTKHLQFQKRGASCKER